MIFAAVDPGLIALGVALVAPLGAYLAAARRLSGRIKDSEATELWTESRSIREWSTERIKELNDQIDILKARLDDLQAQNSSLTKLLEDERANTARMQKQEIKNSPQRRYSDKAILDNEAGGSDE